MSFEGRRISEPSALRALSHPLRLRIIELLEQAGPITATAAAAHLGTTPSNCSFHLRLLAKHGFIEEADGGVGRNRPWRRVDNHVVVKVDELDADARDAVPMLIAAGAERLRTNGLRWFAARDEYPQEWREAAGDTHLVLNLTAAELAGLRSDIDALVAPFRGRETGVRDGAEPVAFLVSALPLARPNSSPHEPPD
jgi:DNA-binding transcriptional ArsR family regulator